MSVMNMEKGLQLPENALGIIRTAKQLPASQE
jgi:hypothetical protein